MSHNDVYKWFELYFPLYAGEKVSAWFQNGKNSIRVRQTNGQEFIFTYRSQKDWRFETVDSYIEKTMKGGKANG
jgi:hypothetical protein|nr:MAG TPA: hypothetical protein [Caudoviricetes sp.]